MAPAPKLHPGLIYTLARLGVFVGSLVILYVIGFRSWFLALGALLVSAPLSYFLLRRQRERFAQRVEGRVSRRRAERQRLRAALRGDDHLAE